MIKIAIVGKMCSGKSYLSDFIVEYYYTKKNLNIKKVAFADKVYELARDLFNMKEKDRKLLQSIGTKMREIDCDVWINYLLKTHKNENIIVEDGRYENEIKALHKNGFYIIKLELDKDTQFTRLKIKYPETYKKHIVNMEHESETCCDLIPKKYYNCIVKSDENLIEFIRTHLLDKDIMLKFF